MLYLVAHSIFNGQSKNSNLFPLPELHETQFKKNRGALGTRMYDIRKAVLPEPLVSTADQTKRGLWGRE